MPDEPDPGRRARRSGPTRGRTARSGIIRGVSPPPTASRITWPAAASWGVFCLLMILVGLQERWHAGEPVWPWPMFYEASSMLLATAVAAWRWLGSTRDDGLLDQPRRWFWRMLRWAPLAAVVYTTALYGLRHAVRAAFGLAYEHQPWSQVYPYECLKFMLFYLLFTGVVYGLRSFRALAAERLRAAELERLTGEARLAQLTQQMQPHFLFNALNTIASLVHTDAPAADAALLRLASLLRAATQASRQPVHPLAAELALARDYAALMSQRFGARVQLRWQVDESLAATTVPALSLQPLLENCFVHAVEPRRAATTIEVEVARHGERLRIEIRDDGNAAASPSPGRPGVALANLRERLRTLYGPRASLALSPRSDGLGMAATLELPLAPEAERVPA